MYDMQYKILSDSNVGCTITTQPAALQLWYSFHSFDQVLLSSSQIIAHLSNAHLSNAQCSNNAGTNANPFCVNHHLSWIRGALGAVAYPSIHYVRGSISSFFFSQSNERTCRRKTHMQTPQENPRLRSNPKTSCCEVTVHFIFTFPLFGRVRALSFIIILKKRKKETFIFPLPCFMRIIILNRELSNL